MKKGKHEVWTKERAHPPPLCTVRPPADIDQLDWNGEGSLDGAKGWSKQAVYPEMERETECHGQLEGFQLNLKNFLRELSRVGKTCPRRK